MPVTFFLVKAAEWGEKSRRMKRFLCAVAPVLFALAPCHAIQLRLTDMAGPELIVSGEDGAEVKRFSAGTVGETIEADGQKFVLSFGEDADGSWVAVLSPSSPEPKDFELKVSSELPAILRSVESGLVGAVTINGRKIPAGMLWLASSNVKGPVAIAAKEEATVTVRWVGPGMSVEPRQTLAVFEESKERGPAEFVEFAQPDPGIPPGQISPVADPEILTLPYEPVINPALLGFDLVSISPRIHGPDMTPFEAP